MNKHESSFDWGEWAGAIYFFGLIALVVIVSSWANIVSVVSGHGWDPEVATSCSNVTSYDQNWKNDMQCTRSDGSTFYTDYAGAEKAIDKAASLEAPDLDVDVTSIESEPDVSTDCEDVTSYDHDWSNDMYCTRADGSHFYTDYAGAREAETN